MADGESVFDDPEYIEWVDGLRERVDPDDGQKIGLIQAGILEKLVQDPRVRAQLPVLLAAMQKLREAIEAGGRDHPDEVLDGGRA